MYRQKDNDDENNGFVVTELVEGLGNELKSELKSKVLPKKNKWYAKLKLKNPIGVYSPSDFLDYLNNIKIAAQHFAKFPNKSYNGQILAKDDPILIAILWIKDNSENIVTKFNCKNYNFVQHLLWYGRAFKNSKSKLANTLYAKLNTTLKAIINELANDINSNKAIFSTDTDIIYEALMVKNKTIIDYLFNNCGAYVKTRANQTPPYSKFSKIQLAMYYKYAEHIITLIGHDAKLNWEMPHNTS